MEPTLTSLKSSLSGAEVIVVDQNAESTGLHGLVNAYNAEDERNTYIYLKDTQVGLSAGRNLGLSRATMTWIWFLDDDAILPGCLGKTVRDTLTANAGRAIILHGTARELESNRRFIKRAIFRGWLCLWNFDSVCSIALIFNRRVFEHIGAFDRSFGVGARFGAAEESDIVLRALKAGMKALYLRNLTVCHPKENGDARKRFSYGFGVGALYRKHIYSSPYLAATLGLKFVLEIVARTAAGLVSAVTHKSYVHLYYLRGFLKGFASYTR